jgi:hypothetical protein
MTNRPLAITIIGLFLIGLGSVRIYEVTLHINDSHLNDVMSHNKYLPIWSQYILALIGNSAAILAGVGVIYKRNWARLLISIWPLYSVATAVVINSSPISWQRLIVPGALYAVVLLAMFSPKGNNYFKTTTRSTTSLEK